MNFSFLTKPQFTLFYLDSENYQIFQIHDKAPHYHEKSIESEKFKYPDTWMQYITRSIIHKLYTPLSAYVQRWISYGV